MANCEVCKSSIKVQQNIIYENGSKATLIQLCALHDQELFIMGQYRFVKMYRQKLSRDFQVSEPERKKIA